MGAFFAKLMACGTVACVITISWGYWLGDTTLTGDEFTRSFQMQLIQFFSMGAIFFGVFIGACYKMKVVEFFELFRSKVNDK